MFKGFLDSIMFNVKYVFNKKYNINENMFKEEVIDFIIW